MIGLSQVQSSIRRTDLDSRCSSEGDGSPDLTLEARFREQLQQSYAEDHRQVEFEDGQPPQGNISSTVGPPHNEDEASYEFRLFAGSSGMGPANGRSNGLQRIALRSPTPINGEPGFIKSQRPEGHYFTGATSAEQAARFFAAAVSGEQVLEGLKARWRGLELPWRVTIVEEKLPAHVTSPEILAQNASVKRKRSGKKRRIITRKRIEEKSAIMLAAQQSQAEKEAAERDKRTRKNREKKVKKKQKEKLKKSLEAQDDGRTVDSD